MKLNMIILVPLLPAAVNSWTLELGGKVFDGTGNRACSKATANAGSHLVWDRPFLSKCCLHLYSDTGCGNQNQNGYSCSDWEKDLGQNVKAFSVTNCG
jgi:hypothetical protein